MLATSMFFVLLAFCVSGWTIGWFVGSSDSPVVATLIPLLFGLIGALSYGFLDRRSRESKLYDDIQKLKLDDPSKKIVTDGLDLHYHATWLPGIWAISVGLFCWFCYCGTRSGINDRVPEYPSTQKLMEEAQIDSDDLTSLDWAVLHRLRWKLQQFGIPLDDAKNAFSDVIKPALEDNRLIGRWNERITDENSKWWGKHKSLEIAVDHLLSEVEKLQAYPTSYRESVQFGWDNVGEPPIHHEQRPADAPPSSQTFKPEN